MFNSEMNLPENNHENSILPVEFLFLSFDQRVRLHSKIMELCESIFWVLLSMAGWINHGCTALLSVFQSY